MFAPRSSPPTRAVGRDSIIKSLEFRVWAKAASYLEDQRPWKCVAAFQYLQECLDYIAYCQDRGSDVVFQSPADCVEVKAADRRVVWKPIPEGIGGEPPRTPVHI